jgi:hypothetical protein
MMLLGFLQLLLGLFNVIFCTCDIGLNGVDLFTLSLNKDGQFVKQGNTLVD